MTPETAAAIYDRLIPGWRDAPRHGQHRRVAAPYREDADPSLDIHESDLVWFDRGLGEGGGAVDLARRTLGEERTTALLREIGNGTSAPAGNSPRSIEKNPKPQSDPEILGPPTTAQVEALKRVGRLRDGATLEQIGAKLIFWLDQEWLGIPAFGGSWKAWALGSNGKPRHDEKGLVRRNIGQVSLVASPALCDKSGDVHRIFDVEGESDFLAAVEAGIHHVITSTGGAGTLAGHKRHRDWLVGLRADEVVVIRDRDSAGRDGAQKIAGLYLEMGFKVRKLELPEKLGEHGDLKDYLNGRPAMGDKLATEPLGSAADLGALADAAELVEPRSSKVSENSDDDLDARLAELAQLSPIEYDRCRDGAAKELEIRVSTLDAEVKERRPQTTDSESGGTLVLLEAPELWPDLVDGAELLNDIADACRRFLALPKYAAAAIALWVMHAHAHAAATISAILAIISPEKRCGKTLLLSILQRITPRPLPAANITAAALFRSTEKWRPTLLVDEADSFLKDNEELRGILNSGHNRPTAFVIRTVGDDHEPRAFGTWSPKAIAMIGNLPSTLEDRSITISMRRRRPDETVERLRGDQDHGFGDLARRCARWAEDHMASLREADPKLPGSLNDRAADNWRPLVAIAEAAGGDWPAIARKAAEGLTPREDETSLGTLLLADIRDFFGEAGSPERMASKELCEVLVALPDRPWSEIRRGGKPLTTNGLSRRLRPFGVRPQKLRLGDTTANGYRLDHFSEAFERYLSRDPRISTGTPEQVNENRDLREIPTGTSETDVPVGDGRNPLKLKECSDVPVGNQEPGPDELEEVVL